MERFKSMHFFHVTSPHTVGHAWRQEDPLHQVSQCNNTNLWICTQFEIYFENPWTRYCIILISTDDNTEN